MTIKTLPLFLITVLLAAIPARAGVVTGSFSASGLFNNGTCDDGFDSYCASGQCYCTLLEGTLIKSGHKTSIQILEGADEGVEVGGCLPIYSEILEEDGQDLVGVAMGLQCGTGYIGGLDLVFTPGGPSFEGRVTGTIATSKTNIITVHGTFSVQP